MNKINLKYTSSIVGSLLAVSTASADFQGISIYEVEDNGLAGLNTYRVYVDVDEGDQVNAIWGDESDELFITSSGHGFYQNQFGSHRAPSESLFSFFPSLEFDSFVTIGLLNDTGDAMMDIGIDWTDFEDNGGDIWTDNGTWFATPDDQQCYEVDGRVVIGQFTTSANIDPLDPEFHGIVNILGKSTVDGIQTSWQYSGVEFPVPAPSAIALLGLAGVAARRRRK